MAHKNQIATCETSVLSQLSELLLVRSR
jgi:hypothetical protein